MEEAAMQGADLLIRSDAGLPDQHAPCPGVPVGAGDRTTDALISG